MKMNSGLFSMFNCFVCLMVISADIPRYDDNYEAKFYDVHKGRLFPIMKAFVKRMSLEECAYACIQFLDCESINYNEELNLCELCNDVYDEYEAIENASDSWYNYATPPKQDGGFTQWSIWNDCLQTTECDEATHRYRTCTNPRPDFGGNDCLGHRFETKKCKRNFPCSSKQNNAGICYSKENPKGFFEAKHTGVIKDVVLHHKIGSIRCYNQSHCINAYWGCVFDFDNCTKDFCFSIHIFEEDSGERLVPSGLKTNRYSNSYNLPSQAEADPIKITLKVKQEGFNVTRGKRYYVTLGRYHILDYAGLTGYGTHCIDLEFIYTAI